MLLIGKYVALLIPFLALPGLSSETPRNDSEQNLSCREILNNGGNMASVTADSIIERFDLAPLPAEGGYFRETYRNKTPVSPSTGTSESDQRTLSTAILYLVTEGSYSALHRLKGDEIFHFYAGDPVEMVQITAQGELKTITLGSDVMSGNEVQVVVPAHVWQGTRLKSGGRWALLGTTMAPGFDFRDFELANGQELIASYPNLKDAIIHYTKPE